MCWPRKLYFCVTGILNPDKHDITVYAGRKALHVAYPECAYP